MKIIIALVVALSLLGADEIAHAADQAPSYTVEAQRQRAQLRHDVDAYVSSAITLSNAQDETVERWTYQALCPMVAGLTNEQGEFLLARVSQIAHAAGAPLDSEHCGRPNLIVIVTADPDGLIKRLERHPENFNREATRIRLEHFESSRPVRVWYNVGTVGIDGNLVVEMLDTSSNRARPFRDQPVYQRMPSQYGSRLNASTVTHDILSVIEIVDRRTTLGLTMGQLADYVAMAGLAQVEIDRDFGNAPTILGLFSRSGEAKPAGVTPWDTALLHALYQVKRSNKLALSEMEDTVFASISTSAAK